MTKAGELGWLIRYVEYKLMSAFTLLTFMSNTWHKNKKKLKLSRFVISEK